MADPIITFESRAEWYGVPARDVLEIAQLRSIRPVPRAPQVVAGLAEIHGRIVTLIDLDRLLAGGAPDASCAGLGVVLAPPYDHLGILVRSGVDVATSSDDGDLSDSGDEGGLLRGRLPVGERLLNLLDLPALVTRVEDAVREGFRPGPGVADEEG